MAHPVAANLALGSSKVGLSLRAQLVDTTGTNVGIAVSTGFVEVGLGNYLWTYTYPEGFRGGVKFYDSSAPGVLLAFVAINPEEFAVVEDIAEVQSSLTTVSQKIDSVQERVDSLEQKKEIVIHGGSLNGPSVSSGVVSGGSSGPSFSTGVS